MATWQTAERPWNEGKAKILVLETQVISISVEERDPESRELQRASREDFETLCR